MTVSSYVPNDTFLVGGRLEEQSADHSQGAPEALWTGANPNMLLLTGPNYSGKSVYMKQVRRPTRCIETFTDQNEVALIVYMAQTGRYENYIHNYIIYEHPTNVLKLCSR